jgi:dihydroorotate dehydrogenase electron transfer subunit
LKQVNAGVISNSELMGCQGAKYFLMEVTCPEVTGDCRPGQFFMLQCGRDSLLRRPVSIHSIARSGRLQFLYAVPDIDQALQGPGIKGTQWLSHLKKGDELGLIGPLGNGFSVETASNSILIVAGGIGIAPLKYLAEDALAAGKHVTLLAGARTASGLFPRKMLPAGVETVIATDDGSEGIKSSVVDLVQQHIGRADMVFACGPLAMYQAMTARMPAWGADKPVQVSLEVRMGCGFGVCYGCSIKTKQGMQRVCKEGPVFNIKDIIWQEVKI